MLKLVATVRTTCTPYELTKAFVEAWKELYGVFPTKRQIAIPYAQNALETGSSTQMWNWNIGNIKVVDIAGEIVEYMALHGVFEYINGKRIEVPANNPSSWFRSFQTLKDGVVFYFNFLKNKRYRVAWTAVEAGDPASFAHLLRIAGYYTAPEDLYLKAEMMYFNKFMQADYFEQAMKELNPGEVQPISHSNVDLGEPEISLPNFDEPLTPSSSGLWDKVKNLFKRKF